MYIQREYNHGTRANKIDGLLLTFLSAHPSCYLFPTQFDCCIAPLSNPSSYALSVFCQSFKKAIYATIEMQLVRTNGVSTIVGRARTRDNERPWRAKYATYRPLAHTERTIQTQKGLATASGVWEGEDIPLFVAIVVSPLLWRHPELTVILDFERDGGMMTKTPYGVMFCHIFGRLFDVLSQSGHGKMVEKSAISISTALRRCLFIVKIDRCAPEIRKNSKTIPQLNCV